MSIFRKKRNDDFDVTIGNMSASLKDAADSAKALREALNPLSSANWQEEKNDEWIWVTGYKGTDKDMCCMGYQYELTKRFDIPEDTEVKLCSNGFHFCKSLRSVFPYYGLKDNNRFFVVKALVRKEDYEQKPVHLYGWPVSLFDDDKYAAKSIIFEYELTDDEIFDIIFEGNSLITREHMSRIREYGEDFIRREIEINTLIEDGYSVPFATYIVDDMKKYEDAHMIASQKDLSMDMRVAFIMRGISKA